MKRRDLIRHLERYGCEFFCEGSNHTVYVNRQAAKGPTAARGGVAEIHRGELQRDCDLLQSGQTPVEIEPLR